MRLYNRSKSAATSEFSFLWQDEEDQRLFETIATSPRVVRVENKLSRQEEKRQKLDEQNELKHNCFSN